MSSNSIVAMIDEEIDRLRKLRAIFASLRSGTHAPKAKRAAPPRQTVAPTPAVLKDLADEPVVDYVVDSVRDSLSDPVLASAPQPVADLQVAPVIVRLPSREPRRRRPREAKPVEQPLALRGAIPTSPVVVRSAAPKPMERVPELPVAVEPGSFAALVRTAERELQTIA